MSCGARPGRDARRSAKRRWQKSPVTGEITKETVKTIAQGMPVDAVYLWLLTRVLFVAHAASGATRIRHSLRPLYLLRVVCLNTSGKSCRENANPRLPSLRGAKRRSNPDCCRDKILDCFASLAMTVRKLSPRRPGQASTCE